MFLFVAVAGVADGFGGGLAVCADDVSGQSADEVVGEWYAALFFDVFFFGHLYAVYGDDVGELVAVVVAFVALAVGAEFAHGGVAGLCLE